MKKPNHIGLTLELDSEICTGFSQYRSNSCRGAESLFLFPLNFVPTLKPKIDKVEPSPMHLNKRKHELIDDSFELCADIK